jgi:signal transduction histidine kinase
VLDDMGLVAAVRDRLRSPDNTTPHIEVKAPADRLDLPAAVELAALRIVQEAVTNVRRHAAATRCMVTLALTGDQLHIEVLDDGRGLPDGLHQGLGLRSIRERAAELGGNSTVTTLSSGGVQVLARLPVRAPARQPEQAT